MKANVGSHPPLYYIYLIPFYILSLPFSSYGTIILLRIGSLILGTIALSLSLYITRLLFPQQIKLAYMTTFLLSVQPMFSFISSIVNIDIMTVVVFLGFILLSIELFKTKTLSPHKLRMLTLYACIASLVKPQLIIINFLFGILIFFNFSKMTFFKKIILIIVSITPSLLWIGYKFFQEGSRFATYSVQVYNPVQSPVWQYPIDFIFTKQPIGIFMSFWGYFGPLTVPMPKLSYLLYVLFILITVAYWLLRWKTEKINFHWRWNVKIFLIISFILYCIPIFSFDILYYILSHTFFIPGRYFAPILPLVIIFLLTGINILPQKQKDKLYFLFIFLFGIGQIVMITTLTHYY